MRRLSLPLFWEGQLTHANTTHMTFHCQHTNTQRQRLPDAQAEFAVLWEGARHSVCKAGVVLDHLCRVLAMARACVCSSLACGCAPAPLNESCAPGHSLNSPCRSRPEQFGQTTQQPAAPAHLHTAQQNLLTRFASPMTPSNSTVQTILTRLVTAAVAHH